MIFHYLGRSLQVMFSHRMVFAGQKASDEADDGALDTVQFADDALAIVCYTVGKSMSL